MIRLDALGPLRVWREGAPVGALEGRLRNLAVLTLLGVEREMTRERLAAYLWADREPRKARQSLSEALYELRKALGDGRLDSRGPVLAATEGLGVDTLEFQEAVAGGEAERALDLYGGHFLRGFALDIADFEQWAQQVQRELFGLYRTAAHAVITEAHRSGDDRAALVRARNWVELQADDDEAQHFLIALLALSGNRSGALRQYETYRKLLGEMELSPLDRTVALAAAVRDGDMAGVKSTFSLAPNGPSGPTDRLTQRWATPPRLGPRVTLIRGPEDVEGATVPLASRTTTIGPGGDIPVSADGSEPVLATLERAGEERGVSLVPRDGTGEVYLLVTGPRVLRAGDTFRIGRQVFTLEREG